MRRRSSLVALCALGALVLLACSSDGRALRAPPPGATVPPSPSTTVAAIGNGSNDGAVIATATPEPVLASPAFVDRDPIPTVFTCDAPGAASPPLAWTALPPGTVEVAISLVDPDAGGRVHWVVAGIDPSVRTLEQGKVPDGAVQLRNGAGSAGFDPPCPPTGAAPHRYVFTLYALGQPSGLTEAAPTSDALITLSDGALGSAMLVGTFQRSG